MRVAVVTDSAANLPPSLTSEAGITAVPMYLTLGGREYRDGIDIERGDFYRLLVDERAPASTAGPPPADFLAAFEFALADAGAVVCVTVASFVSVTHASAVAAAGELGSDRVRVVDSKSASMGEGFVALEAARAAAAGASLDEVEARAIEVAARMQVVATINTFEYLKRSGRVHALKAYAGTALNIKPVFAFRGGAIEQLGRPRSRSKAIDRLVAEAAAAAEQGPLHLAVAHAACPDEAEALLERLRAETAVEESFLTEFTPLMGAHTGPGVLAACFWA